MNSGGFEGFHIGRRTDGQCGRAIRDAADEAGEDLA